MTETKWKSLKDFQFVQIISNETSRHHLVDIVNNYPLLLEVCKAAHKWAMLKNDMDAIPWIEDIERALKAAGETI